MFILRCVVLFCMLPLGLIAQVQESFTDGDFTSNPTWVGDAGEFIVNGSQQLQSNGPASNAILHLSTASNFANEVEWRFWVRCAFNPSTSNFARIYLISDQADLEGSVNGYFIQIGGVTGSVDAIDLFRQDGSTVTKILGGIAGHAGKNDNILRIKVLRDNNGTWTLYADTLGGNNFLLEGSTTDNTYTSSQYFGFQCTHTATRNTSFYLDDIYIGQPIIDTLPPALTQIQIPSNNSLVLTFSEDLNPASAQDANHYVVSNGINNPQTATLLNATTVQLDFASTFADGFTYTLTINNLQDLNNNPLTNFDTTFIYVAPAVAVEYDVVFNELMADPDPAVGLPAQEFIEIYNRSNKTLDLANWTLSDLTTTVTLPTYTLAPGAYLILCANANVALFSPYGPTLGLASLPSLNNTSDQFTLKNQNGEMIDQVAYTDAWYKDAVKKNGGWTLERVSYQLLCRDSANWRASVHPDGGTPGQANSILNQLTDTQAPQLLSVAVQNPTTLILTWNEPLDSIDATNPNHYVINNGIGTPSQVLTSAPFQTLTLSFPNPLQPSTLYDLVITNLKDCIGNINNYISVPVGLPEPAAPQDVVINELMVDPDPPVNLPAYEFVEIFNASNKIIDLTDWQLTDGSSTATLTPALLLPNEYLILCSASNVSVFSPYGKTMGLTSFPSLNNTSETLTLLDNNGTTISRVSYTDAWYKDATKKNGGWTLERIDPFHPCEDSANWRASLSPDGGTPAQPNAALNQFTDLLPPTLQTAYIQPPNQVLLQLNESIDTLALNPSQFNVSGIGNPTSLQVLGPSTLLLTFNTTFAQGASYTLTVQNLQDCMGNLSGSLQTTIAIPVPPQPYDIVFTEIMADPDPVVGLPEYEYVELYNRTNHLLDLSNATFSDATSTVTLPNNAFILPNSYVLLTSTAAQNELQAFGQVIAVSSFPSLNNSGEKLVLKDRNGIMLDYVVFSDDWYPDAAKKDGGWSLERIDKDFICFNPANWKASEDPRGGTPAQANSVQAIFSDNLPPNIQQIILLNLSTIIVRFSETMSDTMLANPSRYEIAGIGNPTQALPNEDFTEVTLWLPVLLDTNKIYALQVYEARDCAGNVASLLQGEIHVPVPALTGEVILNEILFNPRTGGKRYVELYNKTGKVLDVGKWRIGRADANDIIYQELVLPPNIYLKPYGYVAFTEDTANVRKEYSPPAYAYLVPAGGALPSYDDKTDKCVIRDSLGNIMDALRYDAAWHYADLPTKDGVALERLNPNEPTQSPSNWFSASATVRHGTPGYKNSQQFQPNPQEQTFYVEPPVFSPDFDGFEDLLAVHYRFQNYDNNVRISIFDSEGRLVKTLQNNLLIGNESGYFLWDGTDEENKVVPIGTYVLLMEVVNIADGSSKRYKAVCAVAKKR